MRNLEGNAALVTGAGGGIDILHNNAADLSPQLSHRDGNIEAMPIDVWDRTFAVNVRGTMLCCTHAPVELHDIVAGETLAPYLGVPADIANAVAFLAGDESRYITGHNLIVDGGTVSHVPGFARFNDLFGAA